MADRYALLREPGGSDTWTIIEAVPESEYVTTISHYEVYLTGLPADRAQDVTKALNAEHQREEARRD